MCFHIFYIYAQFLFFIIVVFDCCYTYYVQWLSLGGVFLIVVLCEGLLRPVEGVYPSGIALVEEKSHVVYSVVVFRSGHFGGKRRHTDSFVEQRQRGGGGVAVGGRSSYIPGT